MAGRAQQVSVQAGADTPGGTRSHAPGHTQAGAPLGTPHCRRRPAARALPFSRPAAGSPSWQWRPRRRRRCWRRAAAARGPGGRHLRIAGQQAAVHAGSRGSGPELTKRVRKGSGWPPPAPTWCRTQGGLSAGGGPGAGGGSSAAMRTSRASEPAAKVCGDR